MDGFRVLCKQSNHLSVLCEVTLHPPGIQRYAPPTTTAAAAVIEITLM